MIIKLITLCFNIVIAGKIEGSNEVFLGKLKNM